MRTRTKITLFLLRLLPWLGFRVDSRTDVQSLRIIFGIFPPLFRYHKRKVQWTFNEEELL